MRAPASMRRATTRFAVLVALVAGLTACGGENHISLEDQALLTKAITTQVRGVSVEEVSAAGNGFNNEYTFTVRVRSTAADAGEARSVARQVSRVAWNNARASSERIEVTVALSEPGCDSRGSESPSCRVVAVSVPTDAARRLWGKAHHGDRQPSASGSTFVPGPADGLPDGWRPDMFVAFTPKLAYNVIVPAETTDAAIRDGVDRIAAFLWHEHPDRLTGITVNVVGQNATSVVPAPPDPSPLIVSFTADQLRTRFGPRAPDLDR